MINKSLDLIWQESILQASKVLNRTFLLNLQILYKQFKSYHVSVLIISGRIYMVS